MSSEFNWNIYRFHDFQNILVHEKDAKILHTNSKLHKKKKNKPTYAASYKTQLDRESGEWP